MKGPWETQGLRGGIEVVYSRKSYNHNTYTIGYDKDGEKMEIVIPESLVKSVEDVYKYIIAKTA